MLHKETERDKEAQRQSKASNEEAKAHCQAQRERSLGSPRKDGAGNNTENRPCEQQRDAEFTAHVSPAV